MPTLLWLMTLCLLCRGVCADGARRSSTHNRRDQAERDLLALARCARQYRASQHVFACEAALSVRAWLALPLLLFSPCCMRSSLAAIFMLIVEKSTPLDGASGDGGQAGVAPGACRAASSCELEGRRVARLFACFQRPPSLLPAPSRIFMHLQAWGHPLPARRARASRCALAGRHCRRAHAVAGRSSLSSVAVDSSSDPPCFPARISLPARRWAS